MSAICEGSYQQLSKRDAVQFAALRKSGESRRRDGMVCYQAECRVCGATHVALVASGPIKDVFVLAQHESVAEAINRALARFDATQSKAMKP